MNAKTYDYLKDSLKMRKVKLEDLLMEYIDTLYLY